MWHKIIISLTEFIRAGLLTAGEDGAAIPVGMGPAAGEGSYPAVRITRNMEPGPTKPAATKGECKLFIDCSIRDDDIDAAGAYAKLAALEEKVFSLIPAWQAQLPRATGAAGDVEFEDVMSDECLTRPIYESRTILTTKWRKS